MGYRGGYLGGYGGGYKSGYKGGYTAPQEPVLPVSEAPERPK